MVYNLGWGILSIIANGLGIIGYLPEIYTIIYNKKISITTHIWAIWMVSGFFALSYAMVIKDQYIIISSCISVSFNLITFTVKYWRRGHEERMKIMNDIDIIYKKDNLVEYEHHILHDHEEFI
jgi:lipid-A-disaccharide synthase-like uncharacterized protein